MSKTDTIALGLVGVAALIGVVMRFAMANVGKWMQDSDEQAVRNRVEEQGYDEGGLIGEAKTK